MTSDEARSDLLRGTATFDLECEHVLIEEDIERVSGIEHGTCVRCHATLWAVGPEDEQGIPGWELTDEQPREYVEWRGTQVEVT